MTDDNQKPFGDLDPFGSLPYCPECLMGISRNYRFCPVCEAPKPQGGWRWCTNVELEKKRDEMVKRAGIKFAVKAYPQVRELAGADEAFRNPGAWPAQKRYQYLWTRRGVLEFLYGSAKAVLEKFEPETHEAARRHRSHMADVKGELVRVRQHVDQLPPAQKRLFEKLAGSASDGQ